MKKLLCGMLLFSSVLCFASDDTNKFEVSASYRVFPGDERSAYYGLDALYHGGLGYDFYLRGSSSDVSNYRQNGRLYRSGGDDVEFMAAKTFYPNLRLALGFAAPRTAARNQSLDGTYNFSWIRPLCDHANLSLGTRGVIFGGSVGVVYVRSEAQARDVHFFAEGGVPYTGQNTYNTTTGNRVRRMVASIGAKFDLAPNTFMQLEYTNELGSTTGLSVTPSLGGSFGLGTSIGVRF